MNIDQTMDKCTNDIMASENNTGYTNISGQVAGKEVGKKLGFKKGKYEAGEVLICILYRNDKEGILNVNVKWKVWTSKIKEMSAL